ncbi:hypothetical protein [Thiorhodococcus minor]|uniref:Uncharacterized protein n=1 Tax=Thiorhodococcus minor TaxID=57489 RepID=A0A6M0JXT9_9GAMM|nr:hypothetical protein [Thiorhodococcus minor]NEV62356.1 hypothetical protein [Thiorhodococcus minor]
MPNRTDIDANGLMAARQGESEAALEAQVDNLLSAEKPTKPMFRASEIPMTSLRESAS